ncbi:MAG: DNA polymerase III subunit gamma and tau, partial [Curtobacterium sp.]
HHYPFRLVPPAAMLEYVEQLCTQESVSVAPGVLPLVVRAGGGSVRDTLSLLDQLIAGSEDGAIAYERAVALLGYTDSALLDDVVDALSVADPGSAFAAIDRVIQTGQDPRRFVEDLLERLRDLIVVAATNESAGAVLRGVSPEELDTMTRQAGVFGANGLSRGADIANRALTEMTGATSPRLHLELMIARMLVPEADDTQRGALARVERLERRVGVGDAGGHQGGPEAVPSGSAVAAPRPAQAAPTGQAAPSAQAAPSVQAAPAAQAAPEQRRPEPSTAPAAVPRPAEPAPVEATPPTNAAQDAAASWAAVAPGTPEAAPAPAPSAPKPDGHASASSTGMGSVIGTEPAIQPIAAVGLQQMRDAWSQVLEHVQRAKRSAWTVVQPAQVTALRDDVLTLTFPSQQDVASFKEMSDPATSVSELVRAAIIDVLGFRVKFVARGPGGAGGSGGAPQRPAPRQDTPTSPEPASAPAAPAPAPAAPAASAPAPAAPAPSAAAPSEPTSSHTDRAQPAPASAAPFSAGQPPVQTTNADTDTPAPSPAPAPAPAAETAAARIPETPAPSGPVTEWAVATIPATDPTVGAVPDDVEPTWAAPMGSIGPDDTVAPASTPTSGPVAETQAALDALKAGGRGPVAQPAPAAAPAAAAPDVPVDDYPLDDEPFDDGAPFPDPGPGGAPARSTQTAPAPAPTQAQAPAPAQAPVAPAPAAPAQQAAPQVRRPPVPGRYGEAVVREILGAQFIEETSLSEGI